jgi:hypothetical protein
VDRPKVVHTSCWRQLPCLVDVDLTAADNLMKVFEKAQSAHICKLTLTVLNELHRSLVTLTTTPLPPPPGGGGGQTVPALVNPSTAVVKVTSPCQLCDINPRWSSVFALLLMHLTSAARSAAAAA